MLIFSSLFHSKDLKALRMNSNHYFSLLDISGTTKFTIRIIHATNPQLSIVQVYYLDKMAAVAHTIGSEQLPPKALVRIGYITWWPLQGLLPWYPLLVRPPQPSRKSGTHICNRWAFTNILSENELVWTDLKAGYRDINPSHGCLVHIVSTLTCDVYFVDDRPIFLACIWYM